MTRFLAILVLAATTMVAQSLQVESIELILEDESKAFYYPKFSPDDAKLLLTSQNYKGLWLYDMGSNAVSQISDFNRVGYSGRFDESGDKVLFETTTRNGLQKQVHNYEYNIAQSVQSARNSDEEVVKQAYHKDGAILLNINSTEKLIEPLGKGNYIWVSLSPNGNELLFTYPGEGTFVSDLEGKILLELGRANSPKWSPDGNWIVYMVDEDDGHDIISSDIYATNRSGEKVKLTETDNQREMFPMWSSDGSKIAYNTYDGKLYLIHISYN